MKITVTTTPSELIDRGVWQRACDMLSLSEWVVREGYMDSDAPIVLSEDQVTQLGLYPFRPDVPAWVLGIVEAEIRAGEQKLMDHMLKIGEDITDTALWRHRRSQFMSLLIRKAAAR
jgi:hypothetical protein